LQITIYIIIALLKLLLSILLNKYKTLIVRGLVRSKEGDIDNYKQADYMTLEGALFKAIAC
jgi:hypothetical protein